MVNRDSVKFESKLLCLTLSMNLDEYPAALLHIVL